MAWLVHSQLCQAKDQQPLWFLGDHSFGKLIVRGLKEATEPSCDRPTRLKQHISTTNAVGTADPRALLGCFPLLPASVTQTTSTPWCLAPVPFFDVTAKLHVCSKMKPYICSHPRHLTHCSPVWALGSGTPEAQCSAPALAGPHIQMHLPGSSLGHPSCSSHQPCLSSPQDCYDLLRGPVRCGPPHRWKGNWAFMKESWILQWKNLKEKVHFNFSTHNNMMFWR